MKYSVFVVVSALVLVRAPNAQEPTANSQVETAIRDRLKSYVQAFNENDAAKVAGYWTENAVSLNEETGARTVGRDAIRQDFTTFFEKNGGARLGGTTDQLRVIQSDVAIAEGEVTLVVPNQEPVPSAFTAVLVKEGDQWYISNSQERELPSPSTAYEGLKELGWLVGNWHDQVDDVQVDTTIRWSANRAYLIRSFNARFADGESFEGTQLFGWDPLNKAIRTWVFNSDGSFADGNVSKNGEEWLVKMTQVLHDGRLGTSTQVIKRIDADTVEVHRIAETIDGEPIPASEPVVVVRTRGANAISAREAPTQVGTGGTP